MKRRGIIIAIGIALCIGAFGVTEALARPGGGFPRWTPTPTPSRAGTPGPVPGRLPGGQGYPTLFRPAGNRTIEQILQSLGRQPLQGATPLVAVFVTIGALQMLFAGGNSEKFKRGQKTVLYAAIGFALALIASGVTALFEQLVQ